MKNYRFTSQKVFASPNYSELLILNWRRDETSELAPQLTVFNSSITIRLTVHVYKLSFITLFLVRSYIPESTVQSTQRHLHFGSLYLLTYNIFLPIEWYFGSSVSLTSSKCHKRFGHILTMSPRKGWRWMSPFSYWVCYSCTTN